MQLPKKHLGLVMDRSHLGIGVAKKEVELLRGGLMRQEISQRIRTNECFSIYILSGCRFEPIR